ncbi:MAG: hypothetical protein HY351_04335 [Candidatus Omnitrophica bacterium]|nr:hypothetical protein [Candidatus Omnitrophota bacterium]
MKKELALTLMVIVIAGGLSACASKTCPPCLTSTDQTQGVSLPQEESVVSHHTAIK